ncbi:MAG: hypothetical protein WAM89_18840 [Terriglobales bacterium]
MKKLLLLFCLVAMFSLAANATTTGYTVSFSPYCDGMSIASYTGIIFGGYHIYPSGCGPSENLNGGGFVHAAAGYTYYTGAAFDFSDITFAVEGVNSSLQFLLQVAGTTKHTTKCGWTIYAGEDGVGNYFINEGTCTLVSRPDQIRSVAGAKATTDR